MRKSKKTVDKGADSQQTQAQVVENMKARLQLEGREARNLIAYSLPLQDSSESSSSSSVDQVLAAGSYDKNGLKTDGYSTRGSSTHSMLSSDCGALLPPPVPPPPSSISSLSSSSLSLASLKSSHKTLLPDGSKSSARRNSMKQEKRSRSVSAGRNPQQCLRARHWGFLFRNLQQAVDQIYTTCETDESVIECREAILMLERYTKDFRKLIEWLKIKWEYENTPPLQRPTSLAWEIRTSSQSREHRPLTLKDVKRALNFDSKATTPTSTGRDLQSPDPLMVQQLAEELAADISLSSRINFAAKVDRALTDRAFTDRSEKILGDRFDFTLKSLEEKGGSSTEESQDSDKPVELSGEPSTPKDCDKNNLDITNETADRESSVLNKYDTDSKGDEEENSKTGYENVDISCGDPSKVHPLISGCPEDKNKGQEVPSIKNSDDCDKKIFPNEEDVGNNSESSPSQSEVKNDKNISSKKSSTIDGKLTENKKLESSKDSKLTENSSNKKLESSKDGKLTETSTNKKLESSKDGKLLESSNKKTESSKESKSTESSNKKLESSKEGKLRENESKRKAACDSKRKVTESDSSEMKKKIEPDGRRNLGDSAIKSTVKPPTVTMNKAWQVRQAFNQSRAPIRQPPNPSGPRHAAPAQNVNTVKNKIQPWLNSMSPKVPKRVPQMVCQKMSAPVNTLARAHNFTRSHTTLGTSSSQAGIPMSQSWADRVRGHTSSSSSSTIMAASSTTTSSASLISSVDESSQPICNEEGWEVVVRKGRRSHSGSTASLNKNKSAKPSNWMRKRYDVPSSATSMPSLANLTVVSTADSSIIQKSSNPPSSKRTFDKSQNRRVSLEGASVSALCSFDDKNDQVFNKPSIDKKSDQTVNKVSKTSNSSSVTQNSSKTKSQKSRSCEKLDKSSADSKTSKVTPSGENKNSRASASKTKQKGSFNAKTFINRGRSSSDISIEVRRRSNKTADNKANISDESKAVEDVNAVPVNSSTDQDSPPEGNPPSRYGALMDEVHEVDEESTEPIANVEKIRVSLVEPDSTMEPVKDLEPIKDKISDIFLEIEETAKDVMGVPPEVVLEAAEDLFEEEEIRHNAEALECAVQEELRLKQQIEEEEEIEDDRVLSDEDSPIPPPESDQMLPSDESLVSSSTSLANDLDDSKRTLTDSEALLEMFATLDWAEECDAPANSSGVREPGRVLQIHEKLSSPSRKLSLGEKQRRHNEKLAKAEIARQSHMACKTERLRELLKRIEEVNADKERLQLEKRTLLQRKMERAETKRQQHLQDIVDKAHDEDNKGKEIAFINGLEAQNKLHDILLQHQSHSSRLADMAEERSRRQEEKAAKEAAAQERRRALEEERQARLLQLCEKRRARCERIDRQQAERREELMEQAREKERDRQERRTALMQAQQAKECELVRRIQQKQQESARRHEENIEHIKRKAFESTILRCSKGCDDAPKIDRYERQKLCTLCQCLLSSEVYLLSHIRGVRHQDALRELHAAPHVSSEDTATYNLKHIIDAPDNVEDPQITRDKERQKALKKRCRKIRSRMSSRAQDYKDSFKCSTQMNTQNSKRLGKALNTITKLEKNQGSGPWGSSEVALLEKSLLELLRIFDKKDPTDQTVFCSLSGFEKLCHLLGALINSETVNNIKNKSDENKENPPCNEANLDNAKIKTKKSIDNVEDMTDDSLSIESFDVNKNSASEAGAFCCILPPKSVGLCSKVLYYAVKSHPNNCRHLMYSNLVSVLLDLLMQRLAEMNIKKCSSMTTSGRCLVQSLPSDPFVTNALLALSEVLSVIADTDSSEKKTATKSQDKTTDSSWTRLQDVISYCVCVGVIDKVSLYLSHVQGPQLLEVDSEVGPMILSSMSLLSAMTTTLHLRHSLTISKEDTTQLLSTLQVTDACGVVSLLYGLLLHEGGRSTTVSSTSTTPSPSHVTPVEGGHAPSKLSPIIQSITVAATTLLQSLALLDLKTYQSVLGSEGISLEFRHVASYLLWHCGMWPCDQILHNVISLVGFLAVNSKDNQSVVQSGETPTVLQQLCGLPWRYFSEPSLTALLFPTLLACSTGSEHNTKVLHSEMSPQVLEDFLKDEEQAKTNPLMVIIRETAKV